MIPISAVPSQFSEQKILTPKRFETIFQIVIFFILVGLYDCLSEEKREVAFLISALVQLSAWCNDLL